MDFSKLSGYYGLIVKGAEYTILVSMVSLVIGFILGLLICLMKMSKVKILKLISSAYIQILEVHHYLCKYILFIMDFHN